MWVAPTVFAYSPITPFVHSRAVLFVGVSIIYGGFHRDDCCYHYAEYLHCFDCHHYVAYHLTSANPMTYSWYSVRQ